MHGTKLKAETKVTQLDHTQKKALTTRAAYSSWISMIFPLRALSLACNGKSQNKIVRFYKSTPEVWDSKCIIFASCRSFLFPPIVCEKKKKDKARFYNNFLVQAAYHLNGPLHISEQTKFVKVRNLPPSSWVRWVRLGKQAQHRVECGGFVGVSERMVSPIQIPAFQWRPVKSQWEQWICSFLKQNLLYFQRYQTIHLRKEHRNGRNVAKLIAFEFNDF